MNKCEHIFGRLLKKAEVVIPYPGTENMILLKKDSYIRYAIGPRNFLIAPFYNLEQFDVCVACGIDISEERFLLDLTR